MATTMRSVDAPREVNPSVFNGLDRQLDEANLVATNAEWLADALCGGRPPEVGGGASARSVPNGLLSQLEQHQSDVSAALNRAGAAIDRIRNQLP